MGDGDTGEGVLAPVAAVQSTDEGACLFVRTGTRPENAVDLEEGVVPEGFYAVPVEVGTSSGMQVRILSGVEQDTEVFVGYQRTAPSGGDTTSQGDGTQTSQSGFPGGDFSGGFPGGGGGMPSGGMPSGGMGGGRPG